MNGGRHAGSLPAGRGIRAVECDEIGRGFYNPTIPPTARMSAASVRRMTNDPFLTDPDLAPGLDADAASDPDTLRALVRPRSIAVVGASRDPDKIGGRIFRYVRDRGFAGPVYPVSAGTEPVQGDEPIASLEDLPSPADLVFVVVPAKDAPDVVRAADDRGCGACVVVSSGFAESGPDGELLQERIEAIARETDMRIVGPNCMGVMNPRLGLFGTFMSALDEIELPPGNVALISQSGAFGTHAALLLRNRGLDLSLWCTTGNECDVDVADGIACAARDEDTEVIVAYLEGCRDPEKLEAALSVASETRKPIVVLKTGQSAAGAAAARAHTAADAGDDARFSEMFERSGVYRARTIEELIDVVGACAANAFPNGRRAGLMTISGGVGVVMADAAVRAGLDVAPMPVPVERELKALLPFASARNPIDCTAQAFNDWSLFDRFLDAVVRRGGYDSIVLFLATVGANPAVMDPLMDRLEAIRAAHHDRVMAVSLIIDDERRRRLERAGFLVFEDPTRAVNTVAALAHIGDHLFRRRPGATRGNGE